MNLTQTGSRQRIQDDRPEQEGDKDPLTTSDLCGIGTHALAAAGKLESVHVLGQMSVSGVYCLWSDVLEDEEDKVGTCTAVVCFSFASDLLRTLLSCLVVDVDVDATW